MGPLGQTPQQTEASTADAYAPPEYWGELISGSGSLENVGHPGLGRYNDFAYRFRLRALKKVLADMDLSRAGVFEAAFGEGFYLRRWQQLGAKRVAGMDIATAAAESARRRFPQYDLRCGDLSDPCGFEGLGRFDLVTAIDVLYHIVDDEKWSAAVRNLLNLVSEGGAFLFTDKFPRAGVHQVVPHVRRRSVGVWESVLKPAGFEIVRFVPVFVFMDDAIPVGHAPLLGRVSMLQWRMASKLLRTLNRPRALQSMVAAGIAGMQLLPELVLTGVLRHVPNLEIAVCRRMARA